MNHTNAMICEIGDLNKLARDLDSGMEVNGRIVQCVGDNLYLLRVRGFNIITESLYPFDRFDEVRLIVKSVDPQFVFQIKPLTPRKGSAIYA